jgi:hypothetical protein
MYNGLSEFERELGEFKQKPLNWPFLVNKFILDQFAKWMEALKTYDKQIRSIEGTAKNPNLREA